MINCIIIEDEPLAMERAKEYVLKVPLLHLLKTFDNGMEALLYIKQQHVDLIFLDIQMDGFSGIQLIESLQQRPAVIITSAHNQYAIKGFDLDVTDFLLKPCTFERFMQAVLKVQDDIAPGKKQFDDFVFIKTSNRLEKIWLNDILLIEGRRDTGRSLLQVKN